MRSNMAVIVVVLLVAAVLLLGSTAMAFGPRDDRSPGGPMMSTRGIDNSNRYGCADLTEEQVNALGDLRQEYASLFSTLREEMAEARSEGDRDDFFALLERFGELKDEMRSRAHEVLGDEQVGMLQDRSDRVRRMSMKHTLQSMRRQVQERRGF